MSPHSTLSPSSEKESLSLSASSSGDRVVSSTTNNTGTNITTPSDDDRDRLSAALLRLGTGRQPYASLNELVQHGVLSDLAYSDLGADPSGWKARVSVYCHQLGTLTAESAEGSKQLAKREAARHLFATIFYRALDWQEWSDSDEEEEEIRPSSSCIGSPSSRIGTAVLTKKQTRVLTEAHQHLTHLQHLALTRSTAVEDIVFLSVDVEKNERGPEILEVGLASVTASNSWFFPEIHCRHLILEDHAHIHNHRAGYDNKHHFNFGASEMVAQHSLASKVLGIIEELGSSGRPVVLIGHSVHNDVSWLHHAGVTLDLSVCDIGRAYQAQHESVQQIGLRSMMDTLGIEHRNLHNAGNDAFYTMEVCLRMMEMIDSPRQKDQANEPSLL